MKALLRKKLRAPALSSGVKPALQCSSWMLRHDSHTEEFLELFRFISYLFACILQYNFFRQRSFRTLKYEARYYILALFLRARSLWGRWGKCRDVRESTESLLIHKELNRLLLKKHQQQMLLKHGSFRTMRTPVCWSKEDCRGRNNELADRLVWELMRKCL